MKKLLILFLIGLITISCSHDFTTYNEQETKKIKYNEVFEQTFGTVASNQTWGFSSEINNRRSAMPNSNEWGTNNGVGYINFPTPEQISDEEKAQVITTFSEKGKTSYESIIDVDSFFVQQIYCGPNGHKMNELATTVNYKRELITHSWWPLNQEVVETECEPFDDIINNFNKGEGSNMLMYNSATKDFSYKTSQSGGERIYGHWRMEKINGHYYVGFDHEAWRQAPANANEEDKRDYIYNDWIVRIVPSKEFKDIEKVKESGRIICEDMGTIGDFDFNDVVFDATIYESGKTIITLLAAGGTLDISVAGIDVSSVMGKMVNTGVGNTCEPYTFTAKDSYNSLKDIPIIVSSKNSAGEITSYALSAEKGKAPQKICVPTTFKWCKEYKEHSIDKAYPGFKNWVNNGNFWSGEINEEHLY